MSNWTIVLQICPCRTFMHNREKFRIAPHISLASYCTASCSHTGLVSLFSFRCLGSRYFDATIAITRVFLHKWFFSKQSSLSAHALCVSYTWSGLHKFINCHTWWYDDIESKTDQKVHVSHKKSSCMLKF